MGLDEVQQLETLHLGEVVLTSCAGGGGGNLGRHQSERGNSSAASREEREEERASLSGGGRGLLGTWWDLVGLGGLGTGTASSNREIPTVN